MLVGGRERAWLVLVVLVTAVAVLAAACVPKKPAAEPAAPKEPVKLGILLPLTGDLGFLGGPMTDAAKLAVKLVNEAGGILGREVVPVVADTQTKEVPAREGADRLINVERVQAFVGAAGSGESFAALSVAKPARVVQVSPSSTSPDFTTFDDGGFFFRTAPSDALQGAVMAKLAYDEGARTAGTLALNNPYGVGFKNVFVQTFQQLGGTVVADVLYDPGAQAFASEVERLAAKKPDYVVLVAYPETGSAILQEAYRQGALDVKKWLLSEGLQSDELASLVGKDPQGNFIIADIRGTRPKSIGPAYDFFAREFEKAYGRKPTGPFDAHTFDAALLILLAIEKAGKYEGVAIRDAMLAVASPPGQEVWEMGKALELLRQGKDINFQGASGTVDMDEVGDVMADYEVWQVQRDGSLKMVGDVSPPK